MFSPAEELELADAAVAGCQENEETGLRINGKLSFLPLAQIFFAMRFNTNWVWTES